MVFNFMINEDISDTIFYNSGGIGNIYISKCGTVIYKVTYNISAYINNIKWDFLLKNCVPHAKLINFFMSAHFDQTKFINNHTSSMQKLLRKSFPEIDMTIVGTPFYVLVYDAYDCNAFGFLLNAPRSIVDRTLPFLIIWAVTCMCSMHENNFYHNDLKLDNILLRRKFVPTITKVGKFIIENKTDFDFVLNDFDMTLNKNVFCDIAAFKNSLSRMASQRGDIEDVFKNTILETDRDNSNIKWLYSSLTKAATDISKKHMCVRMF